MTETEQQQGQKTVVAFIAGLLIGGLLVWVFSSSPTEAPSQAPQETENSSESNVSDDSSGIGTITDASDSVDTNGQANQSDDVPVSTVGDGSLSVVNQIAGDTVVLGQTTFPNDEGWVVVRDYIDGTPGKVLGAARFEVSGGLVPTSVKLLRATESGRTYQILYYTESGDRKFDLRNDAPLDDTGVTFTVQ